MAASGISTIRAAAGLSIDQCRKSDAAHSLVQLALLGARAPLVCGLAARNLRRFSTELLRFLSFHAMIDSPLSPSRRGFFFGGDITTLKEAWGNSYVAERRID